MEGLNLTAQAQDEPDCHEGSCMISIPIFKRRKVLRMSSQTNVGLTLLSLCEPLDVLCFLQPKTLAATPKELFNVLESL